MKIKPKLLLLAVRLSTLYGGMKQLDNIKSNGEIIMDYSISDEIKAGFGKIVLIVQEHMIPILTKRDVTNQNIAVEFVEQSKELLIDGLIYFKERPLVTALALWCSKEKVIGHFLLIKTDDFYEKSSFKLAFNDLL